MNYKPSKVILPWWGYIFWFLPIFGVLLVHEKSTFIPSWSVFIEMTLHAIYGLLCKHLLFSSKFWIISNFRGRIQQIQSNWPSNGYTFILIKAPKLKKIFILHFYMMDWYSIKTDKLVPFSWTRRIPNIGKNQNLPGQNYFAGFAKKWLFLRKGRCVRHFSKQT